MTYEESVQQAAHALIHGEQANWDLARHTWENTVSGRPATGTPLVTLSQWAQDVRDASGRKFSAATASVYRRIWAARLQRESSQVPVNFSWVEAYYEENEAKRPEAMRARATNQHLGLDREIAEATPERKAEVATHLLRDPDVLAAIDNGLSPVSTAITDALATSHRRSRQRAAVLHHAAPVLQEVRNYATMEHLGYVMEATAVRMLADLAQLEGLDLRAVQGYALLHQAHERLAEALGAVTTFLATGCTDHDRLLRKE